MRFFSRLRVGLFAACLAFSGATAAEKPYANEDLAASAERLQQQAKEDSAQLRAATPLPQLRLQAQAEGAKGDIAKTMPLLQAIVAAAPENSADWLLLARAALLASQQKDADEPKLRDEAFAAAYQAYLTGKTKPEQANALLVLGELFSRQSEWRNALNVYRISLAAQDNPALRKVYEDLREKYGFRILEYKIDNESVSPRACFQFSEDLLRSRSDFAPFVTVAGQPAPAVSSEERQVCVEGLKHGEHYNVTIRAGLPSNVQEDLFRSANYDIYVRDRSPQARFTGRNYVLPRVGPEGVPVVSVNTRKVLVDIYRVGDRNLLPTIRSEDFLSQLSTYRLKQFADSDGAKIWTGSLDVQSELNKDVVTDFPVLEALGTPQPGVYVMSARAADDLAAGDDDWGLRATQWFVVSDLGLTALSGPDGLTVLVRSLAGAMPKEGVELRLIAKNNEKLGVAKTDASGVARFDPGLSRGTGGMSPGLLVASDGQSDYNFLDLQQNAFDLTDRGVKGREAPKGMDAFVYAERGVYRSGETVFLTALLRDPQGLAIAGAPLTLVVKRPDGVEFKRVSLPDQGLGGRTLSVTLPADASSGGWTAQAFADPKSPAIGETSFLVEDYTPERLELTLTPKVASARVGETAPVAVAVRYLYGAPGAGLNVSGDVEISAATDHGLPVLAGYEAGVADEDFSAIKNDLDHSATTDDQGAAIVDVAIPDAKATRPLQAKITLRAGETGGRGIERVTYLPLLPPGGLIGVKKTFAGLSQGGQATFDLIAIGADGKRTARKHLRWSLYQIRRDYQWYKQDGRWNFEQVKSSSRVADGFVDLAADSAAKIAAPVNLGHYRLDLRSEDPKDAQTSVTFDAGWSSEAKAETPDVLEMTLDKPAYSGGDTLTAKVTARADANATLTIIGDKARASNTAELKKGENEIKLPVSSDWGAGAYALVLAHRPLDKAAGRNPGRALGLAWFAIDPAAHRLDVVFGAPAKARPREKLEVPLEIRGLTAGEETYVTVAAVDLGIINLTRYATPDPRDYFYGQRALSTEVRDLYGLLIDGLQGARGAIRTGGDGGGPEMGAEKPTQEPLALYSGMVKVGPDGKARVAFDLPAFNGTVRLTAVAWSKARAGSASADVIVRDPVVVQASLPHFLALNDNSRLHLRFDNVEGAAGDYKLSVALRGPLAANPADLRRTLKLAASATTSFDVPLRAAGVGQGFVDITLTGPKFEATQTLPLALQAGTSALVRRVPHDLAPGASLTLDEGILADFIPGTGAVSVNAAPLAGVDVAALLDALDKYPFGCSEQTVSRALPLLYLSKLGGGQHLAYAGDPAEKINAAIAVLLARQDSSGAFGLWSANNAEDVWLTAFVGDFLTRAREAGYAVPQKAMDQALDRLRNYVVNASEVNSSNSGAVAYAIYVLARNGRPVTGDLRYLTDARLDAFVTPLSRAQLAGAAALTGDRARANRVFMSAAQTLQKEKESRFSRADYGSLLRDGAGLLALGAENGADAAILTKAAQVVEAEAAATRYASTQEESWMTLAAQAFAAQGQGQTLIVDGVARQGAYSERFDFGALKAKPVTIANTSDRPIHLSLSITGRPKEPEPAEQHGYSIERSIFTMDGTLVDPQNIPQNERLVVALKVIESEPAFAHLVLTDRLPAGLEIDNPALYDGGSVEGMDWVKAEVEPSHTEYKDDRFVASFERAGASKATFSVAYIVRAVSPGTFVAPPATIEDMYRPDRFGRSGFGTVKIVEPAKK